MSANAISVQAWAVIDIIPPDGVGPPERFILDILRCAGSFALNDRPRCSLALALGRNSDDVTMAAPIHKIVNKIRSKQQVSVYVKLKTMGLLPGENDIWPADPFRVFEGYTTGFGYRRSTGSVEYVMNLEHWLGDLSGSSAISAQSSPENPSDLTFNALLAVPSESVTGTATTAGMTGMTMASRFITPDNVATDFWGSALQPFLISLTSFDNIVDVSAIDPLGLDLGNGFSGNMLARQALLRIEPVSVDVRTVAQAELEGLAADAGVSLEIFIASSALAPAVIRDRVDTLLAIIAAPGVYTLGVPLQFDQASYSGDLAAIAGQISWAVGSDTLEALSSTTIWDKLVEHASTYMFAISPLVDRALVVPFIPGLRQEYKTIFADDYEYGSLQGDMPRVLRGIGVYGGLRMLAGDLPNSGQAVEYNRFHIGGYFQGASSGVISFKQCPSWLLPLSTDGAAGASGGGGGVRGNALDPGAGPPSTAPTPNQRLESSMTLLNRYARCLYVYESLKFRSGDLSGRLRFDIGPGSIVAIEGCGEKFLGTSDQLGDKLWAAVLQVDFLLDAENSKAGTSFRLAHIRSKIENERAGYSIDRHPIWEKPWSGCPLIPGVP